MGSVSNKRARGVYETFLSLGETETAKHYNISIETVHRYIRMLDIEKTSRHPKILLFDIETLPCVVYSWGIYKQNLSHENIIKDWCVLSWSAKWLYSSDIMGEILSPQEVKNRDDKRIINSLWDLFDKSDVIIAHNLKKFDNKRAKTRFILNNLTPPSPYQTIDTLEIARSNFSFTSNRLDYLGLLISRKGKIETNYRLWKKCDEGDQESLDYMLKYNKEDVNLLESVYMELRPWMKSHPNIAIYSEATEECCPVCGSFDLSERGHYTTMAGRFESLICNGCGAPSRRRTSILTKIEKENLLISNAR